ncbi:Actin-related protein 4 [Nosema granulosis]|uniref:Actin-related protein 4 n=1 Tax=Nosema granulosis TaxID=83296 RepID=A0A9P6GW69_9MICR|nr:Actin-related protein 4 [Nosema granulosis]
MFVASDRSTVVVDIGTETYKIGYSDNGIPTRFGSSSTISNGFVSPVKYSKIVDVPAYLKILRDNIPQDTSYLCIAENTFEEPETRKEILRILMEEDDVSSLFFAKSGLLDSFSYGKYTSLVLSFNGGSTQVCSIINGIITNKRMIPEGCLFVTNKFRSGNSALDTYKSLEQARMKKEDYYEELKRNPFGEKETSCHSEILKIVDYAKEILDLCSEEERCLLLSNILVAGSGSTIPFIQSELDRMFSDRFRSYKIRIFLRECRFHTFFGGVVFSNIGSTKLLHIGKMDYQEYGVSILERKEYLK